MKKNLVLNYNTSKLKVCVDSVRDNVISGRVFSQRIKEPLVFRDLSGLVLQLETLMDEQNYPQSFQRKRIFKSSHAVVRRRDDDGSANGDDDGTPYMSEAAVGEAQGEALTFILHVMSRQNSGWQGYVRFLDGSGQDAAGSEGPGGDDSANLRFDSVLGFFAIVNRAAEGLE
jgi:hypothetical protein